MDDNRVMNYDPLKLIDEPVEETAKRLRSLAREELEEAVASGEVVATAFDGSLSSGKFWPSSDLDVTIVPNDPEARGLRGGVRAGIGVHEHVQGWSFLGRLHDGWPASWTISPETKWYWLQDEVWLLDGLVTLLPVHDPDGKLAALKKFVKERRFSPKVLAPRWRQIMRGAGEAAKDGFFGTAGELVASIWLEAAQRIISGKEMDPELRGVCAALGEPEAHAVFRRVAGVDVMEEREAEFARACRKMLEVYSPFVDGVLAKTQFKIGPIEAPIPMVLYMRQTVWSGIYASQKGCLMHLAAIKRLFEEDTDPDMLNKLAAESEGELVECLPKIEEARLEMLAFFRADPTSRMEAFRDLALLTRRKFSIRD